MDDKTRHDLQIIDFVGKNPELQTDYVGRACLGDREILWRQLASQLGCDSLFCKTRWVNIRAAYRKNLKKQRATPYKYHKQLAFLALDDTTSVFPTDPEDDSEQEETNFITEQFIDDQEEEEEQEVDYKPLNRVEASADQNPRKVKRRRRVSTTSEEAGEDPLSLFFRSMCASTRRLSSVNIRRVRKELFELVSHLEEAEEFQSQQL